MVETNTKQNTQSNTKQNTQLNTQTNTKQNSKSNTQEKLHDAFYSAIQYNESFVELDPQDRLNFIYTIRSTVDNKRSIDYAKKKALDDRDMHRVLKMIFILACFAVMVYEEIDKRKDASIIIQLMATYVTDVLVKRYPLQKTPLHDEHDDGLFKQMMIDIKECFDTNEICKNNKNMEAISQRFAIVFCTALLEGGLNASFNSITANSYNVEETGKYDEIATHPLINHKKITAFYLPICNLGWSERDPYMDPIFDFMRRKQNKTGHSITNMLKNIDEVTLPCADGKVKQNTPIPVKLGGGSKKPTCKPGYLINPETNKCIKRGGPTHQKLKEKRKI